MIVMTKMKINLSMHTFTRMALINYNQRIPNFFGGGYNNNSL